MEGSDEHVLVDDDSNVESTIGKRSVYTYVLVMRTMESKSGTSLVESTFLEHPFSFSNVESFDGR